MCFIGRGVLLQVVIIVVGMVEMECVQVNFVEVWCKFEEVKSDCVMGEFDCLFGNEFWKF